MKHADRRTKSEACSLSDRVLSSLTFYKFMCLSSLGALSQLLRKCTFIPEDGEDGVVPVQPPRDSCLPERERVCIRQSISLTL